MIIQVHPLSLINISDHALRNILVGMDVGDIVSIGALLGVQSGDKLEIYSSFELKFNSNADGTPLVDEQFFKVEMEQFKQVFKDYDVIGWYCVHAGVSAEVKMLHQQIASLIDSPVLLLLDPSFISSSTETQPKDVPVRMFESTLEINEGKPVAALTESSYVLQTTEAESISLDLLVNMQEKGARDSLLASSLEHQEALVSDFRGYVQNIVQFIEKSRIEGKPLSPETLRRLNGIRNNLMNMNFENLNGVDPLSASLGPLTKSLGVLSDFSTKLSYMSTSLQDTGTKFMKQ